MVSPLVLSILVICAVALAWRGGAMVTRRQDRTRGMLMLTAAAVMLVDALIWAMPR